MDYGKLLFTQKKRRLDEAMASFNAARYPDDGRGRMALFDQLAEDEEALDLLFENIKEIAKTIKWQGNIHSKKPSDFPRHMHPEGGALNYWFKHPDKDGVMRYFQAVIGRGRSAGFTFREATAGFRVASARREGGGVASYQMTKKGTDTVLATVVAIIQRHVARKDVERIHFSSADEGRTMLYRRLSRLFSSGYFTSEESRNIAREPEEAGTGPYGRRAPRPKLMTNRWGDPYKDPVGGGQELAPGAQAEIRTGDSIRLLTTKDPKVSRIVPGYGSPPMAYVEMPARKTARYLNRGTGEFRLIRHDAKDVREPIVTVADIPDEEFVVIYKLRGQAPVLLYPIDYDKATQLKELEADAHRITSTVSTYTRELKKANEIQDPVRKQRKVMKVQQHPGARIELIKKGPVKRIIKEVMRMGIGKPPEVRKVNPIAYHREINRVVKGAA